MFFKDRPRSLVAVSSSCMSNRNEAQNSKISAQDMELAIRLEAILMPIARKRRDEFYERDLAAGAVGTSARFVHYT